MIIPRMILGVFWAWAVVSYMQYRRERKRLANEQAAFYAELKQEFEESFAANKRIIDRARAAR